MSDATRRSKSIGGRESGTGTYEVDEADPGRDDDGPVREVAARKDGPLRELDLPEGNSREEHTTHNDHRNHRRCTHRPKSVPRTQPLLKSARVRTVVPAVPRTPREREREEDERDAGADEHEADDVQLLGERPRLRPPRAEERHLHGRLGKVRSERGRLQEPEPLRLLLRPEEGDNERRERRGDEDGEHAVCEWRRR